MMMKVLCLLIVVALAVIICGPASSAAQDDIPVVNPILRSAAIEYCFQEQNNRPADIELSTTKVTFTVGIVKQ